MAPRKILIMWFSAAVTWLLKKEVKVGRRGGQSVTEGRGEEHGVRTGLRGTDEAEGKLKGEHVSKGREKGVTERGKGKERGIREQWKVGIRPHFPIPSSANQETVLVTH